MSVFWNRNLIIVAVVEILSYSPGAQSYFDSDKEIARIFENILKKCPMMKNIGGNDAHGLPL